MGFGYLLIGYLVTFVLKLTASALHIGFLALLVGYGSMLLGLLRLRKYCRSFSWAAYSLCPLLVLAVYHMLEELSTAFLWSLPFLGGTVERVVLWGEFLGLMFFHAALLSAIRELGMQVELKGISSAAVRNSVLVLLYGAVYLIYNLPLPALDGIRVYFGLSLTLLNLAWVVCNLLLLLSCAKSICPEGQEEPREHRYRWEVLNRIGDAFAGNLKKASERSRADAEEYLKKRQEKCEARQEKNARKSQHKRKK